MPKMIINLRPGINQDNFKNGDMLVYDATKKEFYVVTEDTFFDKTNSKINELKKKYDKDIAEIKAEKDEILKEKDEIKKENLEFKQKIQESNEKLIEMVESFIKGGK